MQRHCRERNLNIARTGADWELVLEAPPAAKLMVEYLTWLIHDG